MAEAATGAMGLSALTSIVGGFVGAGAAESGAADEALGLRIAAKGKHDSDYFNAGQYDFQALIDERNRAIALDQAKADAHDTKLKGAAVMGTIRAAYGNSGLSIEGSPLDVLQATAVEQALDVKKILYTGDVVAAGLTDQALQARAQASMLRYSGDRALEAGEVAAASASRRGGYQSAMSIISGAGGALRSVTTPNFSR